MYLVTSCCCNTDEQEFDERYIFKRLFVVIVFLALRLFEIYTLQSVIEARLIGLIKHRKQSTSRYFKGNHSNNWNIRK